MAGPSAGAAAVVAVVAAASPEAVLGRGVSALQAPAMMTATRSRTRPGSRRAGVIVGDLRSLNRMRPPDLTEKWFRSNVHRNKAPLRFAVLNLTRELHLPPPNASVLVTERGAADGVEPGRAGQKAPQRQVGEEQADLGRRVVTGAAGTGPPGGTGVSP